MKSKGFLSRRPPDAVLSSESSPSDLPNRMFAGTGLPDEPSSDENENPAETADAAISATEAASSVKEGQGDDNIRRRSAAEDTSPRRVEAKRQLAGSRSRAHTDASRDRRYTLTVRLEKNVADDFHRILNATDSGAAQIMRRAMVSDFKRHLTAADVRKRSYRVINPASVRLDIRLPAHFVDRLLSVSRTNSFEADSTVIARYIAPLLAEYISRVVSKIEA